MENQKESNHEEANKIAKNHRYKIATHNNLGLWGKRELPKSFTWKPTIERKDVPWLARMVGITMQLGFGSYLLGDVDYFSWKKPASLMVED